MKLPPDVKKTKLLDAYELLKENYDENDVAISDLLEMLSKIDIQTAVDMWMQLVKENEEAINIGCRINLIKEMVRVDVRMAVDVWEQLINGNKENLHTYGDLALIMDDLKSVIGDERTFRLIAENRFLQEALFLECGELEFYPLCAISYFIKQGEKSLTNRLLDMALSNSYNSKSRYEIFSCIISDFDCTLSSEAYDSFMNWIYSNCDEEECARLIVELLKYTADD